MTSEGVESFQAYLPTTSVSEGTLPITTTTASTTEPIGLNNHDDVVSNNNNTTKNLLLPRPADPFFESCPENGGVRSQADPTSALSSSTTTRTSDVNNPLSLTPALSTGTATELRAALQSQLLHNNNNTIITKLTNNHLSVKNLREGIAPYSAGHPKSAINHHVGSSPQNQQVRSQVSTTAFGQGEMYDSVMVSSLHSSSAGPTLNGGGGLLIPSTNNHIHHQKLTEPNGNTVDIQFNSSPDRVSSDIMMMTSGGGTHGERMTSYGTSGSNGGNSSDSVMMGLLHGNNSSAHLNSGSLGPSGSSVGGQLLVMSSSHGNGLSLSSPGGSLEDQDCDEEKVINGDTFSPGDVPDPDAIKMFVGQIPKHLSESELKTLFEEFGRVFQINVLRDKVSKQSKGCCFVTFYTRKAALDAQNALHNVKTLSGMNHPIQMKPADNENRYERKLFVGMLSKKCNESDVRTMFSRFGHIDECTVLRDPQGTSRGCAFITFASKQCAQTAIKALHHSLTMEGCSSPVVVKFADTQKDKDQKRTQQIHATIMPGFQAQPASVNTISPQYFTLLQQLHQQQQQQQQQQTNSYFSSLSPLSGIATLASLASPSPGASLAGLTGSHSSGASSDLAALAALANFTGVGVTSNQHSVALGIQAALAAALNGTHSSLSQDYGYSTGANGSSLGSTNSLANSYAGNGLHSAGLSSYTSALRSSVTAASKQAEGPEGANLFIYHLPPEATDPDLISMFSPFGTVISAKVYIDKNTNRSKCFGFVSYDNAMSAQVAIQTMNGFQVGMKRLKVQLKRSKEAAKPY